MPATEKTYYNQPLLHALFAASSLLLLLSTFLLFQKDHNREWKDYQREFMSIEERLAVMQQAQFETSAYKEKLEGLQDELLWAQVNKIPSEVIDASHEGSFIDVVNKQQGESEEVRPPKPDTEFLIALLKELEELSGSVHECRESLSLLQEEGASSDEMTAVRRELTSAANTASEAGAAEKRQELVDALNAIVTDAVNIEDRLLTLRKNASAEFDAAKANLGLGVRDARPPEELQSLQDIVDLRKNDVDSASRHYQSSVTYREKLQEIVSAITADVEAATKAVADLESDKNRLHAIAQKQRSTYFVGEPPFLGKKWTEIWFLDGFGSSLSIDNLWTDGLTHNNNFVDILRFDRCTTCHRGIDKTEGSATNPAYLEETTLRLVLTTPAERPKRIHDAEGEEIPLSLLDLYGFQLAEEGLIHDDDITVAYVVPQELAARASVLDTTSADGEASPGLQMADTITAVNGNKVSKRAEVRRMLVETVQWGEPITLTIRRGFPHPFASHPRLDLFLGSTSPHAIERFGCTVCHDGQGSATSFKWASHYPDSVSEGEEWAKEHAWFDNHHWIYPMHPNRFMESSCLKCHHEVDELRPSEQFAEDPAPTVVHGYDLIKSYGCYGCHEINGFNGDERIGPDMRVEPNYFAAALQLQADPHFSALSEGQQEMIAQLVDSPEEEHLRAEVFNTVSLDSELETPLLSSDSHSLLLALKESDHPGTLRKTGPSLRFIGSKMGEDFLFDWIWQPRHFRPDTRMPHFFGQWDHLEGEGLERARKYEPVEILGIARYLLDRSQSYDALEPDPAYAPPADEQIARGKVLFETQGCLACHEHSDFPLADSDFGPNLSRIADKLSGSEGVDGEAWLYSWLRQPNLYHARTRMPDLFLGPKTTTDLEGNTTTTDTAADIAAYLLSRTTDWKRTEYTEAHTKVDSEALNSLALELLEGAFFKSKAERYLQEGIPAEERDNLSGAEVELVVQPGVESLSEDQLLLYVGRKAITKYGCAACHDIPGFESAQPIGTSLTEWGRKNTSQIAFEHILEYLEGHGHSHGHASDDSHGHEAGDSPAHEDETHAAAEASHVPDGYTGLNPPDLPEYYLEQLKGGHRSGFLYQKLLAPRSYDYHAVDNKGYNERLRMPHFPFNHEEREAVATFILGLVAEPPAKEFVYQPDARKEALIAGRQVIETFNCASCHQFDLDRWEISFPPGTFKEPITPEMYDFLHAHFSPEEIEASLALNAQGLHTAEISGMVRVDQRGNPAIEAIDPGDNEYYPIDTFPEVPPEETYRYAIESWEPIVLEGHVFNRKSSLPQIPRAMIDKHHPAWGGDFTNLMLKRIIQLDGNNKGAEAYGWLPPPLIDEGLKVQSDWLHEFLLDPYQIRPAARLRMPKFNMSPAQATALVNYFAARDDANYPYENVPQRNLAQLESREVAYQQILEEQGLEGARFDDAMQIVADFTSGCVKCHQMADYDPKGEGPDLGMVHQRFRADYLRRWIAKPDFILPYTPMPPLIAYSSDPNADGFSRLLPDGTKDPVYHGHSEEQLDAIVDLLMNYDRYNQSRSRVTPLVEASKPVVEEAQDEQEGEEPVEPVEDEESIREEEEENGEEGESN